MLTGKKTLHISKVFSTQNQACSLADFSDVTQCSNVGRKHELFCLPLKLKPQKILQECPDSNQWLFPLHITVVLRKGNTMK